jgi:competence protein ComEA
LIRLSQTLAVLGLLGVLVGSAVWVAQSREIPPEPFSPEEHRVDLNSDPAMVLSTLPGIGPSRARDIVAWRMKHGGFQRLENLAEVPGIGPKTVEQLRSRILPLPADMGVAEPGK